MMSTIVVVVVAAKVVARVWLPHLEVLLIPSVPSLNRVSAGER